MRGERRRPAKHDLPGIIPGRCGRDAHQQWPVIVSVPGDPVQQLVDGRVVEDQPVLLDAERDAQLDGDRGVRRELPVGPRQDGVSTAVAAVPGGEQPARPCHVITRVGSQDQRAGRTWSGIDALHEPLRDVLHQPGCSSHDLRRAAVVGGQVDPSQAGQTRREIEDPPDVGQPPGVDRLVIVAHQEDVPRLAGEQQCQLQLGPVEVLRLVDEEHLGPPTPCREDGRVGAQDPERAGHQVIEVEHRLRGQCRPICSVGCMDMHLVRGGPRSGSSVSRVNASSRMRIVAAGSGPPASRSTSAPLSASRVTSTPASRRIRRPRAWNVRTCTRAMRHALWFQGPVEPFPQLFRGAPIERHGAHRRRVGAGRDAPADPGHQRRGLAAAGRSDAQHRTRWRHRSRALVRCETLQPLTDGRRQVRQVVPRTIVAWLVVHGHRVMRGRCLPRIRRSCAPYEGAVAAGWSA